jgi:type IV pilus assembly protein PilY1
MNDQAYPASYDPAQFVSGHYFGYFDPVKMYVYQGGVWSVTAADPSTATPANPIATGDFLNWAYMTKVEATKMLLIGGRANPRTTAGCCVNRIGETSAYTFNKHYDNSANPVADKKIYPFNGNYEYERSGGGANGELTVSPLSGPYSSIVDVNGNISAPASWIVTGASAWQAVLTNDGNTSTIRNTTTNFVPAIFSYNYGGPTTDPISNITIRVVAKRSTNTTMRIQGVVRLSGTNYASTNSNLTTSYQTYNFTWNNNPATGNPWQWSEINAALQGFGVQAYTQPTGTNYPTVTQISMVITMTPPQGGPYSFTVNSGASGVSGIVDSLSNDVRFGLGYYNDSAEGGHISTYVDFGAQASMITSINNMVPSTWTPLSETLYEMVRYFRQEAPFYAATDYTTGLNTSRDPYYYRYSTLPGSGLADQYVPCAKSFILFLTDGEPTQDQNIPAWLRDYDGDGNDPIPDNTRYPSNGSDFFDDVAFWARTVDNRADIAGTQNIVLYSVYMFGKGSTLLQRAAIKGGFDDVDSNNFPSCIDPATHVLKVGATQNELKECYRDSNGNGTIDPYDPVTNPNGDLPLTYYQGDDGYELQTSITEALTEILKRSASGTSVSVLGSSWKGEGAIYQAYFYPEKVEALRHVKWTGYFQSLFVDRFGLVHEDTNGDGALKSQDDAVVEFSYVPGSGTMVKYFWDRVNNDTGASEPDGKPDSATPFNTVSINDVKPIWDAGKMLALRSPSDRKIYTSVDVVSAAAPNLIDFNYDSGTGTDNSSLLRPYLRAKTAASAADVIKFVRGEVVSGWRDRQLTVDGTLRTWKLGDIVFSDPLVVPAPKERFDLLYGSASSGYNNFFNRWKNRRAVVYVGGNDGMLHAFNSGFSESASTEQVIQSTTAQVTVHTAVTLDANFGVAAYGNDPTKPVGKELWAFVPYDVLPHLAWLTDPDYSHVFYVDLAVRSTDANIFTPDADHVNGWGTIIIVGMRFGGGEIDVEDNFGSGNEKRAFKSAYYALDVTNPEVPPKLLWRFTDNELGFTLSTPMIVHEKQGNQDKWYAVFGSGPSNFRGGRVVDTINTNVKFTKDGQVAGLGGMSSTSPYLYVIDLATGRPLASWSEHSSVSGSGKKGLIKLSSVQTQAFAATPTAVDYPLDFKYDMIYVGTTYCASGCAPDGSGTWSGSVRRIDLRDAGGTHLTDPGQWRLSRMFGTAGPVSTKPSIGLDPSGHAWVYFGTGRFLHIDDRFEASQQTFYGMKDSCYATGCQTLMDSSNFLNSMSYTIGVNGSLSPVIPSNTLTPSNTSIINDFTGLATYMQEKGTGWYINLSSAERVTVNGFVLGGIAGFGTYIPNSDVCEFEGSSKQWFPSYLTGTALYSPLGTGTVVPRYVATGSGLPSAPAVHFDARGNARLFIQKSTGEIQRIDLPTPAPGGFGGGGECLQ